MDLPDPGHRLVRALRHHTRFSRVLALFKWDGLGTKTWIGLDNYVELFDDDAFYTSLKNNVIWLVLYLLAIPAGLFIALFLNQTVTGIRIYKSLFFFPFVISQVVVGLSSPGSTCPISGCSTSDRVARDRHRSTCWATRRDLRHHRRRPLAADRLLHDPLSHRPQRRRPRADRGRRLDGAKGWKMLWYIILPQLKPATFIAFVVTIIGALRSFDLISIMTNGGPFGSPRAQLLHVRAGAVRIRLPHGLRRGHRGGAVPHHAGLHLLLPLEDVSDDERGTVMFPRPIEKRSRATQIAYQAGAAVALILWLLPLIAVAMTSVKPPADLSRKATTWGVPSSFELHELCRRVL
jgi:hypothetical protein